MNIMEIRGALERAQEKIGIEIPALVAVEVLAYTARKCECNGKGSDYIPCLYENELVDYFTRLAINNTGGLLYV